MKLENLATIRSGCQFRGRIEPDPTGTVRVIQIKDLGPDGKLDSEGLALVALERSPEPCLVQQGDVLFIARGARQQAVAITQPLANTIATSYFFILRPHTEVIRAAFLAWYMNQAPFQAELQKLAQGSHVPFVTKTDLADLSVPVPPLQVQDRIVALAELLRREQEILTELAEKRTLVVEGLCLAAVHATTVESNDAPQQDAMT